MVTTVNGLRLLCPSGIYSETPSDREGLMATLVQQRPDKVHKLGLEVPSALTYRSWEPGGVYTKQIVLKNVHMKTQKIRYR